MSSHSSSEKKPDSGAIQQELDLPSPSREVANVPPYAGLLISGSNVPPTSTSLLAPANSTTQSTTQRQTQSQGLQRVAAPYFARRNRDNQALLALVTNFIAHAIKDWVPHVLSPDELHHLRQATQHRIQTIRHLETERSQMMPRRDLRIEQRLFMAHLDYKVHFGRIFRINHLPPEVLSNIFRYVIWSAEGPDRGVRWRLWVTWVCRHWREIALSDPVLWNAIWFKDLPNFERSLAWLERSADAPLDIRINDTKRNPISPAEMHNLLNKLVDKLSNIRILIIVIHEWDPILVVLHALRVVQEKSLPMILERLEIHRSGSPYVQIGAGYEPDFYSKPIPLFGGATVPSFNYLSLNSLHIDWANSVLTNLTTIDLRRIALNRAPTLSQFRALLAGSPALNKLLLDGAGPARDHVNQGMKPVHIPSLRILILGDFSLSYAVYICSQIFAPNVSDLTIMNLVGDDYSGLYDLLRSKMPLVKILTLYNVEFFPGPRSSISVIKWLQSMPLLTYFRITNIKPQFLELFLYNYKTMKSLAEAQMPSGHIPCPKLAFLEVSAVRPDDIARWAHIRKQLGSPLRKIYLSIPIANSVTEEQYQRLAAALDVVGGVQVLPQDCMTVEHTELSLDMVE